MCVGAFRNALVWFVLGFFGLLFLLRAFINARGRVVRVGILFVLLL